MYRFTSFFLIIFSLQLGSYQIYHFKTIIIHMKISRHILLPKSRGIVCSNYLYILCYCIPLAFCPSLACMDLLAWPYPGDKDRRYIRYKHWIHTPPFHPVPALEQDRGDSFLGTIRVYRLDLCWLFHSCKKKEYFALKKIRFVIKKNFFLGVLHIFDRNIARTALKKWRIILRDTKTWFSPMQINRIVNPKTHQW